MPCIGAENDCEQAFAFANDAARLHEEAVKTAGSRVCRALLNVGLLFAAVVHIVQPSRMVAQASGSAPANVILATSFEAKGDLRIVQHLSFQAGSRAVQASVGTFGPGDVGKFVTGVALNGDRVPVSVASQIVAVAAGGAQATTLDEARATLKDVFGGVGTDNSEPMQRCWDASARRGLVCWVPAGRYLFASKPLVIRSHMSVEGAAPELSTLVCAPSIRDCVGLDEGPVQFVWMSRIALSGTEAHLPPPKDAQSAQRGFNLVAHGNGGGAGGGLWQSTFSHVEVSEFWGDEFTLRGGVGEYMHPNQFLFFEDLELQAARGSPGVGPPPDSYRLRLVGQNAQIAFSGGQIHGSIGSQLGNGVLIDGAGVVRFEGVTCEWLDACLDVANGTMVRFTDGWIENVKRVATLGAKGVRGFTLDHNYLANSCYDQGTHKGWCVKLEAAKADTGVSFARNYLAWGVAAPDALITAPPGAAVDAPGTVENGVLKNATDGNAARNRSPGENEQPWRKAKTTTPWIAHGSQAIVHLTWAPGPFPTDDFTASCVTFGGNSAMRVEGVVQQNAAGIDVIVRNLDPSEQQRTSVECIGVQ